MKVIGIEGTTPIIVNDSQNSVDNTTELMLDIKTEDKNGNTQVLLIAKGDIICTGYMDYFEIKNITNEVVELSRIDGYPNNFAINHAWLIGKQIKLYQEFFK